MVIERLASVRRSATRAIVVMTCLLAGCVTVPPDAVTHAYTVRGEGTLARFAPVFVVDDAGRSWNRLGAPAVRRAPDGAEQVFIDPSRPVVFAARTEFSTARGEYTNLVYRVHFEKVPYSLWPFHLTAGPNGGLFVILTLDARERVVLVTTVHTCGCYVGIVPTADLARDAWPADWPADAQPVYGEQLPARLASLADPAARVVIRVRAGNHRVRGIGIVAAAERVNDASIVPAALAPMHALDQLPVGHGRTSFFHTTGPERGYVRDSYKPLEFLLMSWWMLDLHVGVDKRLGDAADTGVRFYTSFRPWRRHESDLGDFPGFLRFRGWRL